MKNNVLIAFLAAAALAAGIFVQLSNTSATAPAGPSPQLEFSFPDIKGQTQSVAQWRGKILVINFWATWCPPCLKEIPEFIQWQKEFEADSVQFAGIALDDKEAVADFLKSIELNYPMLIAGDEGFALAQQLGNVVNVLPFTVIVDRQGQIVHRQPGELSRAQFLKILKPLLDAKN